VLAVDNRLSRGYNSPHNKSVKIIKPFISIAPFILLIAGSCATKEFSYQRIIVGGPCAIQFFTANGAIANQVYEETDKELERLDSLLSFFNKHSLVSRINAEHRGKLDPDIAYLFALSDSISRLTAGAFDISVAPLLEIWGFYSGEKNLPDSSRIRQIRERVDFRKIVLRNDSVYIPENMKLDLGGIAQGFAADRIAMIMKKYDVRSAIINIAGEIRALGRSPRGRQWRVGIRHPRAEGVIETVDLEDNCLSTSGDYEKFFIIDGQRYPHILNPWTGYPARDFVSVTIFGKETAFCDGIATAVCVMGAEKGLKFLDSLRIRGIIYHEKNGVLERLETP